MPHQGTISLAKTKTKKKKGCFLLIAQLLAVPLVLAAPAAAAGLAYVNAKTSFWYDRKLLACAAKSVLRVFYRQHRDRLNLFYVLEDYARSSSTRNKDLLIFEGRHFSYAQIYDSVLRVGAWLRAKHNVKPGEIIAMDMTNSDTFIVVWWALWSIGARPAFINYNLTGKPLAHSLGSATTRLCLVDATLEIGQDVRAAVGPGIEFVTLTGEVLGEALATAPQRAPDADRHQESLADMAMLIYTSGTTGLPKPAVVSWGKCIAGGTVPEVLLGRGQAGDIMYTSMPLYHSSASILCFCATVTAGSTQALGRRFSTKLFWPEVRASGATSIQYVGETLRYLLAAPPQTDPVTGEKLDRKHKVKVAFGNGLRPDIWNEFKERFGIETIAEFYGATEAPFALWNLSRNDLTAGAIGRNGWLYSALQSLQVALVEVDWDTDSPRRDAGTGFCVRVKTGSPGEMLCRLPADDVERRFQGYYGNPGATSAKVLRSVFAKDDAWFRTGDVARWDSDGRVYFCDRIGDTFRWKSENVSTVEVSHVLGTHAAVDEANVYGVELPHHDGRAGCVAICFRRDACAPDAADADSGAATDAVSASATDAASAAAAARLPLPQTLRSLAAHVRANLPRYAQPLFLRVVDGMGDASQTTGTNKQQKQHLREAGVAPDSGIPGPVYWLQGDDYVLFGRDDWRALQAGRVKL
ncbi:hypothetical protein CDD82_2244 [Ophiocordyceps australis]|uniref:Very long-chain fatty acid transport protein n=1 Tax=Ophiocordyceps australis TaxID=1399860 RepID=A0A2C5XZ68_9HYPO|nr:hypothetical protein CDD82_2244 [Ophiocordyceps australis]